jgi:hypothetical protein
LFASIFAVVGMFAMNGLPRPYHPVFNAPRFGLASQNAFFLSLEAADPKFEINEAREFLKRLEPSEVVEPYG